MASHLSFFGQARRHILGPDNQIRITSIHPVMDLQTIKPDNSALGSGDESLWSSQALAELDLGQPGLFAGRASGLSGTLQRLNGSVQRGLDTDSGITISDGAVSNTCDNREIEIRHDVVCIGVKRITRWID